MTAAERLDYERRELLREERYRATVQRIQEADRKAELLAQRVCEARLRKERQPLLDFAI